MIPCNKCYWYKQGEPYICVAGSVEIPNYCTNQEYINPVDGSYQSAKTARAEAGRECKYADYMKRDFCQHKWAWKTDWSIGCNFGRKKAVCKKCGEVCK